MSVEFIVCTVIGYNLYKNTACVVYISAYFRLANPVSIFLLSFCSVVFESVPGWSTHMRFSGASAHACHIVYLLSHWTWHYKIVHNIKCLKLIYSHTDTCVMVTVVGNGHGTKEFKSWTKLFTFHISLLLLRRAWVQLFNLGMTTGLGEGKLKIQTSCALFKNQPYFASCSWQSSHTSIFHCTQPTTEEDF